MHIRNVKFRLFFVFGNSKARNSNIEKYCDIKNLGDVSIYIPHRKRPMSNTCDQKSTGSDFTPDRFILIGTSTEIKKYIILPRAAVAQKFAGLSLAG